MIYVASPYSHSDPAVREMRFRQAEAFVARLLNQDVPVFSPIVYCHVMAERHRLPTDADFWAGVNWRFMQRCTAFALVALPGWDTSRGVAAERRRRRELKLSIEVWRLIDTEAMRFDLVNKGDLSDEEIRRHTAPRHASTAAPADPHAPMLDPIEVDDADTADRIRGLR